jgi:transforming growth factor-beta-induced protein
LYFFLSAVFAPTNAAFADLPDGALEYLLDNQDILTDVLLYHVISGRIEAGVIQDNTSAETLLGEDLFFRKYYRTPSSCYWYGWYCDRYYCDYDVCETVIVINDDATVVTADVDASNGIIHIIDKVLIPPGFSFPLDDVGTSLDDVDTALDIVDTAIEAQFDTLVAAVIAAELVDALRGPGPLTVFAPSEEAWERLPPGYLQGLLRSENQALLTRILLYHVVSGAAVESSTITNGQKAETLNGADLTFRVFEGGIITVNQATVITANVRASNGIVHVIDQVLFPPY